MSLFSKAVRGYRPRRGSGHRRRALASWTIASALIAGCGFHLQGATTMPAAMKMTYIDAEDERSSFLLTLQRSLQASGSTITPDRAAATAVLHIEHDETGQRVLSVSAANKPTEYEIFYTIKYSVTSEGKELLTSQTLRLIAAGGLIPGSYWGETEAGLKGDKLFARLDTPLHSVLHEAAHYICMTPERRAGLDTDAGGEHIEENAVCYLQILLADQIPGYGRARMLTDMDAWGYTFRLGSAQAWFEQDATDAYDWLLQNKLIDPDEQPTGRVRE